MSSKTNIKYVLNDTNIRAVPINEDLLFDKLPAKVYSVKYDKMMGFYLSIEHDELKVPDKIYGNVMSRVDRCIQTYKERNTSTGILMTGDKGTGKTLLMAMLSNAAIHELDMAVVLVKDSYSGEEFQSFIESLGECCIVFDEFGKMYTARSNSDLPSQTELLSLFDGVNKTKRLVILTENDISDVNLFMLNRPSRVYYHFKYTKLDEASIRDFCGDKNVDNEFIDSTIELARTSSIFTFDILQSIVEEYLRYNEPVKDIISILNVDLGSDNQEMIEILRVVDANGKECEIKGKREIQAPSYNYDSEIEIFLDGNEQPKNPDMLFGSEPSTEDGRNIDYVYFGIRDVKYDRIEDVVYHTDEGYNIIAKRVFKKFDYSKLLA